MATDVIGQGAAVVDEEVVRNTFELLKENGPLCPTQISLKLLVPLDRVQATLKVLERRGIVEKRPDRDKTREFDPDVAAWGLVRSFPRS